MTIANWAVLRGEDVAAATSSYLIGYVTATRAEIEAVFGAPTEDVEAGEDKVSTEWVILFTDEFGETFVATIYDWKLDEKPQLNEEYAWHVGGVSSNALYAVKEELGKE